MHAKNIKVYEQVMENNELKILTILLYSYRITVSITENISLL